MQIKQQSKHLWRLLRPSNSSSGENAGARQCTSKGLRVLVAQHERYLVLQRKLFQAQQRGLPEVLALSQDEAKQWQQMKAEVEKEQVGFCRMMARSLALEAALNKAQVPLAAVSCDGSRISASSHFSGSSGGGIDGEVRLRPGRLLVYIGHILTAIRQLVSPMFPAGWGIPMKSRAIIHESSGTKKRVFLDRPLPGNSREKVAEAGRAPLLSRSLRPSLLLKDQQVDERRIMFGSLTISGFSCVARTHVGVVVPTSSEDTPQEKQPKTAPLSVFVKPDYHSLGIEEQLTTSREMSLLATFVASRWFSRSSGPSEPQERRGYLVEDLFSSVPHLRRQRPAITPSRVFLVSFAICFGYRRCSQHWEIFERNYLLRPQDGYGQSTFGKKRGGVEVLMTGDESATDSPVVDLYSFMPKTASPEQAHTLTTPDVVSSTCTVLPSWNLRDRIPYTYQTGMYCLPFFLEGMCPNVSKGESCDLAHLRLPEQQTASSKKPVKAKRWGFENYTNVLKKATRANFEILNRPKWVTLNYAFCGEEKAPSAVSSITDVHAPVHCAKPTGQCSLPHFTLHQILERLADDLLRKGEESDGHRRLKTGSSTRQQTQHKQLGVLCYRFLVFAVLDTIVLSTLAVCTANRQLVLLSRTSALAFSVSYIHS
ncbi:hypothetical protein GQ600_16549 [Phytophthora cactorum]|nr:hypothetical protein GQ600_16549 [Phytophthora cactorum]